LFGAENEYFLFENIHFFHAFCHPGRPHRTAPHLPFIDTPLIVVTLLKNRKLAVKQIGAKKSATEVQVHWLQQITSKK
jgi:hypothetical protein